MKTFSLLLFSWFCLRFSGPTRCTGSSSAVTRFSVPENQQLCLSCGGSGSSDVVWILQDRRVLVNRQGGHETNEDQRRYLLRPDGDLCILHLDQMDGGRYRCNQQPVAEVQVLTGHQYLLSPGRTLLLSCAGSSRPKQRWLRQREGGRRQLLLTRFRNGTVRVEVEAEAEHRRLGVLDGALQVEDLRPEDGGEYLCNGVLQASVSVLNQPISSQPSTTWTRSTWTQSTSDLKTEEVETKTKEKRQENVLLLLLVSALSLMIVLLAVVCLLLTGLKVMRRKRSRGEECRGGTETELQPWTWSCQQTGTVHQVFQDPPSGGSSQPVCPSAEDQVFAGLAPQEDAIHYASLGRPAWRPDRTPNRTPPDQNQQVIYSVVITRPAAQRPPQSNQGPDQLDKESTFCWRTFEGR